MRENDFESSVKGRLILSGLKELEEHGITDFSLRRVASLAQVSCAAPYRHFKDKEDLILAIISYVREGWNLLADEISTACTDERERIIHLSVAAVRFWIANSNFRSVLIAGMGGLDEQRRAELILFDRPICDALDRYARDFGGNAEYLSYTVLTLIYGSVTLAAEGMYGIDEVVRLLTERMKKEMQI